MIEKEAMYKLTYGLFVLTTTDGEKQNGCIVNTVSMITDSPKRITVFVNNANYSAELLKKTGVFNVSVLTESAPFDIFKQFKQRIFVFKILRQQRFIGIQRTASLAPIGDLFFVNTLQFRIKQYYILPGDVFLQ